MCVARSGLIRTTARKHGNCEQGPRLSYVVTKFTFDSGAVPIRNRTIIHSYNYATVTFYKPSTAYFVVLNIQMRSPNTLYLSPAVQAAEVDQNTTLCLACSSSLPPKKIQTSLVTRGHRPGHIPHQMLSSSYLSQVHHCKPTTAEV